MSWKRFIGGVFVVATLAGAPAAAIARDLVMGLIPAESNEEMIKKFEPMRAYLEKAIGSPIKVFTATSYEGVIEAMKRKRVDIAWFGPLSYVLAEREAGAEPFAVGVMANGKSTYKSIFVVPTNSPAKSLMDLRGKTAAFAAPASTSGNLIPTYIVKKQTGMMPQEFFGKFSFAGSHDASELACKNKAADICADNDITYPAMVKAGQISPETNRILSESEPLPGSPLTYRGDLAPEMKNKIKDAILNAHKHIKVTGYGELIRYDEAKASDYQMIRDLVKELGLKQEDMAK